MSAVSPSVKSDFTFRPSSKGKMRLSFIIILGGLDPLSFSSALDEELSPAETFLREVEVIAVTELNLQNNEKGSSESNLKRKQILVMERKRAKEKRVGFYI